MPHPAARAAAGPSAPPRWRSWATWTRPRSIGRGHGGGRGGRGIRSRNSTPSGRAPPRWPPRSTGGAAAVPAPPGHRAGHPGLAAAGRIAGPGRASDAPADQLMNHAVDLEISQIAQLAEVTRLPSGALALAAPAGVPGRAGGAARRGPGPVLAGLPARSQSAGSSPGAWASHAFAVWLAALRGDASELPADFMEVTAGFPPIPIVQAGVARALFALGLPDQARAVYETLGSLPGTGDKDNRILGVITQILDLIVAFRDRDTAQVVYDLMAGHMVGSGATCTGRRSSPDRCTGRWALAGGAAGPYGGSAGALRHCGDRQHPARRPPVRGAHPAGLGGDAARPRRSRRPHRGAGAGPAGRCGCRRLDMPGPAQRAGQLASELRQAISAGRSAHPAGAGDRRAGLPWAHQPGHRHPAGALRADRGGAPPEHPGQAPAGRPAPSSPPGR